MIRKIPQHEFRNIRNRLRCPKCGFGVFSNSDSRSCARCDNKMINEGKEFPEMKKHE